MPIVETVASRLPDLVTGGIVGALYAGFGYARRRGDKEFDVQRFGYTVIAGAAFGFTVGPEYVETLGAEGTLTLVTSEFGLFHFLQSGRKVVTE